MAGANQLMRTLSSGYRRRKPVFSSLNERASDLEDVPDYCKGYFEGFAYFELLISIKRGKFKISFQIYMLRYRKTSNDER